VSEVSFVEQMKIETFDAHELSKDSNFATKIMGGEWSPLAFVEWQRALHPIYVALEEIMIKNRKDPSLHLFDHRKLDRRNRIAHDLSTFGVDPVKEPSSVPCVSDYVSAVVSAGESPQRIMAYHYTRYMGDMIGGQVISRTLKEKYGMEDNSLTCYDFSDIGDLFHYRKTYKAVLNLIPWSDEERRSFIEEVKVAYEVNANLFKELEELLDPMHEKVGD
jgi:heme oxygenase